MKSIKRFEQVTPAILKARYGDSLPMVQQCVDLSQSKIRPANVEKYMRKYMITTERYNTVTPEGCGQKLKTMG